MTVAELKAALASVPDDYRVVACNWEESCAEATEVRQCAFDADSGEMHTLPDSDETEPLRVWRFFGRKVNAVHII